MILEIYLAGALGVLALIGHKQFQQSQDTKIVVTILLALGSIFMLAHGLSTDQEIIVHHPWIFAIQSLTAIGLSVGFYLLCSTIMDENQNLSKKSWSLFLLCLADIIFASMQIKSSDIILKINQEPNKIWQIVFGQGPWFSLFAVLHFLVPLIILGLTSRSSLAFYRYSDDEEAKRRIKQVWIGVSIIAAAVLVDIPGRALELNATPLMVILASIGVWIIFSESVIFAERVKFRQNMMEKYLPADLLLQITLQERKVLNPSQFEGIIMFCDIRNFTTFSEKVHSSTIVSLLNDYYATMNEVIHRHGGIINKFIGDAILVLFDNSSSDHALKSLKCTVEMLVSLEEFNRSNLYSEIGPLEIGFGLHSGPFTIGHMGCEQRMEYTVVGDTVNVSARIAGMNSHLGHSVLMSENYKILLPQVYQGLLKELGVFPIKGREEEVQILSLPNDGRVLQLDGGLRDLA